MIGRLRYGPAERSPEALLGTLFSKSVTRADLFPGGTGLAGGLDLSGLQFLCGFAKAPCGVQPGHLPVSGIEVTERRSDPPDGPLGGHHHSVATSTAGVGQ